MAQMSPKQVQAAANLGQVVEEDAQARAELYGQLDPDLEDNRKMPAYETQNDTLMSDEDGSPQNLFDEEPNLNDPEAYFAAEEAEHLARTREEVRQFMENDNVPLIPTLAHARQQQHQQDVLQGMLDEDYNNDRIINANPNTTMRDNFRKFCAVAKEHYNPQLTKNQQTAVKLLHTLKEKKAPLNTYGDLMEWHYRTVGKITKDEGL
ncbi:MAG: hypothetical protein LC650_05795, partial [Actinobacteria bacterium]|nr:hypothetical protein [Actinomycetota bacterium]